MKIFITVFIHLYLSFGINNQWRMLIQSKKSGKTIYRLPHNDVIKWKHFPRYWRFVRGIHRSSGSFDVFFDLCLNKRLSKPSQCWWFGTPSCSLWRQCNVSASMSIVGNCWDYHSGAVQRLSRHCNSLQIGCLYNEIFGYPIFKRVAMSSIKDGAPEKYRQISNIRRTK